MLNKHQIEEYFFNKFRELYKDLPIGIISTPDPPDFIIDNGSERIGVEITQIQNEKGPDDKFSPIQKNAIEYSILKEACRLFYDRNEKPLNIRFYFADSLKLNKKQIQGLSIQVSRMIEVAVEGKVTNKDFSFSLEENLPRELSLVNINYHPDMNEPVWYSAKGGFLPDLTKREILKVIKRKEVKINQYLTRVDKIILVIVEGLIPESWYNKVEEFDKNEIISRFDKIFIIRNLTGSLLEIK